MFYSVNAGSLPCGADTDNGNTGEHYYDPYAQERLQSYILWAGVQIIEPESLRHRFIRTEETFKSYIKSEKRSRQKHRKAGIYQDIFHHGYIKILRSRLDHISISATQDI